MRDKTRINEKAHQLISLTTEFCEQHLDDEYEQLCEKLPYATPDNICNHFGTNKSTTSQKAKVIRDMFKMAYWNDEFSTERNKRDNPSAKLMMINGLIVPIDILESESQEATSYNETVI
jgi:hypothetical protein